MVYTYVQTEGPTTHDQPTYASVPGIKVYGMVCVDKSEAPLDESQLKRKVRLLDEDDKSNTLSSASSLENGTIFLSAFLPSTLTTILKSNFIKFVKFITTFAY